MKPTQNTLPKWILVVSGLIAIMEIMVSISMCVSPEAMVESIDLNTKGVDFLIYMWAVRQFALGFIFAFATFKRSIPMLTLSYIFFFVMFVGDLIIGYIQKENILALSAIVMCIISVAMIYVMNKKKVE